MVACPEGWTPASPSSELTPLLSPMALTPVTVCGWDPGGESSAAAAAAADGVMRVGVRLSCSGASESERADSPEEAISESPSRSRISVERVSEVKVECSDGTSEVGWTLANKCDLALSQIIFKAFEAGNCRINSSQHFRLYVPGFIC